MPRGQNLWNMTMNCEKMPYVCTEKVEYKKNANMTLKCEKMPYVCAEKVEYKKNANMTCH